MGADEKACPFLWRPHMMGLKPWTLVDKTCRLLMLHAVCSSYARVSVLPNRVPQSFLPFSRGLLFGFLHFSCTLRFPPTSRGIWAERLEYLVIFVRFLEVRVGLTCLIFPSLFHFFTLSFYCRWRSAHALLCRPPPIYARRAGSAQSLALGSR